MPGTADLAAMFPFTQQAAHAASIQATPAAQQEHPVLRRGSERGDEPATPPLPSPPQTPQCEARRAASGHFAGLVGAATPAGRPASVSPPARSSHVAWSAPDHLPDSDDDVRCADPMLGPP
jgi:hypothetical protein